MPTLPRAPLPESRWVLTGPCSVRMPCPFSETGRPPPAQPSRTCPKTTRRAPLNRLMSGVQEAGRSVGPCRAHAKAFSRTLCASAWTVGGEVRGFRNARRRTRARTATRENSSARRAPAAQNLPASVSSLNCPAPGPPGESGDVLLFVSISSSALTQRDFLPVQQGILAASPTGS